MYIEKYLVCPIVFTILYCLNVVGSLIFWFKLPKLNFLIEYKNDDGDSHLAVLAEVVSFMLIYGSLSILLLIFIIKRIQ